MSAVAAVFDDLMEQMVLDRKPDVRRDLAVTYRKLLLSDDAQQILGIFWRESDFVSAEDLVDAGLPNEKMPKGCNVYALATALAAEPSDVAALNSKVGTIVTAAEAYGLVTRQDGRSRAGKKIVATQLLHDFMTALTQQQERQIAQCLFAI